MYLFHILRVIGLRQLFTQFKVYFQFFRIKELFAQFKELTYSLKWLCPTSLSSIQISFNWRLFAIELAYSHLVLFRLFLGFREINPVFLLISLAISLLLGINSFYYEYSYLSIFGKVDT
jgi:hypothetical protein